MDDEATLVVERQNTMFATFGVVVQGAAGSILSKEAGTHFSKLLSQLSGANKE